MISLYIYSIGSVIAIILGIILAVYFERLEKQKPKEEQESQNYGLIFSLALLSWIAVGIAIWSYRNKWKEIFKVVFNTILNRIN